MMTEAQSMAPLASPGSSPMVQFRNVSKSYASGQPAVHDLNRAAVDARRSEDTLILARTDAAAGPT